MSRSMLQKTALAVVALIAFSFSAVAQTEALKGVKEVNQLWDIREGNPAKLAFHLKLVQQAMKDVSSENKAGKIIVVFAGPSVKLLSKVRDSFNVDDQKSLNEIAQTVSEMSNKGMRLEACLIAAKVFNVDPGTFLPEITPVSNGAISLIGYQAKGYRLVPGF